VTDAAVVGLPKEDGGEQVVAAVTVEDPDAFDPEAAREHCRSHLAAYKVPRRIEVVDDLPKTIIGKVLRRQVRDQLLAG
jgi:long-chain acyl-CoA synthetase